MSTLQSPWWGEPMFPVNPIPIPSFSRSFTRWGRECFWAWGVPYPLGPSPMHHPTIDSLDYLAPPFLAYPPCSSPYLSIFFAEAFTRGLLKLQTEHKSFMWVKLMQMHFFFLWHGNKETCGFNPLSWEHVALGTSMAKTRPLPYIPWGSLCKIQLEDLWVKLLSQKHLRHKPLKLHEVEPTDSFIVLEDAHETQCAILSISIGKTNKYMGRQMCCSCGQRIQFKINW